MSSTAYFAEITPDPLLRRIVLWSGVSFGVAGMLLIVNLPIEVWVKVTIFSIWGAVTIRELRQLIRGWAACGRIRFHANGDIAVLGADAKWQKANWVSGSVLLQNAGWIRLVNERGVAFGELLVGNARTSMDWRRLQVIWRHVGADD